MRTPAGFECKFFYGNYFRGRKQEECRLIGNVPAPNQWTPNLCKNCPVPVILLANACENLELNAHVKRSFLGIIRNIEISAYCTLSKQAVKEPHIGCGQCHPLPPVFLDKK
ncbi:MAG: hypothetical protein IH586_22915 [Anaerolineaceae bacterium]|nr:hypothetical protein [Anaerolineaceae bacterium]